MHNKAVTTVNTLIYKHFVYQYKVLEGDNTPEHIQTAYDRWAHFCIITAISSKHIRIGLPSKTQQDTHPVSHYTDYKIYNGLWVICADYSRDTDQYYLCRNWVQSQIRKCICRARCSGPYLLHTIDLR